MKPHEAPSAAHSSAARGFAPGWTFVLVADDRLPESLEVPDACRDLIQPRVVEVDEQEIGGARQICVAMCLPRPLVETSRPGSAFFASRNQLDLPAADLRIGGRSPCGRYSLAISSTTLR